jgi:hypothetical protein
LIGAHFEGVFDTLTGQARSNPQGWGTTAPTDLVCPRQPSRSGMHRRTRTLLSAVCEAARRHTELLLFGRKAVGDQDRHELALVTERSSKRLASSLMQGKADVYRGYAADCAQLI